MAADELQTVNSLVLSAQTLVPAGRDIVSSAPLASVQDVPELQFP